MKCRVKVATSRRFVVQALIPSVVVAACWLAVASCSKKLAPTQPEGQSKASAHFTTTRNRPSPGLVAKGFRTYEKESFSKDLNLGKWINQYFATGAPGSEIFNIGDVNLYTWNKTGTQVTVTRDRRTVQLDSGVRALQQAVGTGGRPGKLSTSATNPLNMGTGGSLGAQELALKINQAFSEVFVTPATGFSGLTLVDMKGVRLGDRELTGAQGNALNGQAILQVVEAADAALGSGTLPYGLSFSQLTELINLLNESFKSSETSSFARNHLYQPYVTSNAFAKKRPATVSDFAVKPTYNTFQGEVVFVGEGCVGAAYSSFPAHAIALIERGTCPFYQKVQIAAAAGASAAIIFNSEDPAGCPSTPTPGSTRCDALPGLGAAAGSPVLPIPVAFVQRSTGLLLKNGSAPVTVFVQQ